MVNLVLVDWGEEIVHGEFRIGDWLVQPLRDLIQSPETSIPLEPGGEKLAILAYMDVAKANALSKLDR